MDNNFKIDGLIKRINKQYINKDMIFINFHMFKTAGTTRDRIFEHNFPKQNTFFSKGETLKTLKNQ